MDPDRTRRFVTCGETLVDLVPDEHAVADTFSTTWKALSAGGPMNTSVALAAGGADSHFLGRISTDQFGPQLRGHMQRAGVKLGLASTSDLPTTIAVVSLDDTGKASYAFHWEHTANFEWQRSELPSLTADDWLHIGSLAIVLPPGADVVLGWVRQSAAPVSVDINIRPSLIADPADYWQRLRPWLEALGTNGILKASDEDLEFLASAGNGPDAPWQVGRQRWRNVAEQWLTTYGLGLVVVTSGPAGASALDGARQEWVDVPGHAVEVVDTVGAGDTFMAGFLDGWARRGHDLRGSLERGVTAASIVCGRQGAQPPTADEIDDQVSIQRA
jgi:fructokinase